MNFIVRIFGRDNFSIELLIFETELLQSLSKKSALVRSLAHILPYVTREGAEKSQSLHYSRGG